MVALQDSRTTVQEPVEGLVEDRGCHLPTPFAGLYSSSCQESTLPSELPGINTPLLYDSE